MSTAIFIFHDRLKDFLPSRQRNHPITHHFKERASVKDMVESLGVPHPEIEAIFANTAPQNFTYLVEDGDIIEVYGEIPEGLPYMPLRSPLPPIPSFVLDTHLGQLAVYLRMLGFDTLYRNDYPDEELADISSREGRILLTRDKGLLKRGIVTYGYFIRNSNPKQQVVELLRRYRLTGAVAPLRRCIRCNGVLNSVPKEEIAEHLEPNTRALFHEFSRCSLCGQLYWKGSHYDNMLSFIEQVVGASNGAA